MVCNIRLCDRDSFIYTWVSEIKDASPFSRLLRTHLVHRRPRDSIPGSALPGDPLFALLPPAGSERHSIKKKTSNYDSNAIFMNLKYLYSNYSIHLS